MKSKLTIILWLAAVGFSAWLGGANYNPLSGTAFKIHWYNEDAAVLQYNARAENDRKYRGMAIFMGPFYNTNIFISAMLDGTNATFVEFGFRDDRTVVWRPKR